MKSKNARKEITIKLTKPQLHRIWDLTEMGMEGYTKADWKALTEIRNRFEEALSKYNETTNTFKR